MPLWFKCVNTNPRQSLSHIAFSIMQPTCILHQLLIINSAIRKIIPSPFQPSAASLHVSIHLCRYSDHMLGSRSWPCVFTAQTPPHLHVIMLLLHLGAFNPLSASCSCDAKIGAKNTEKNSTGTWWLLIRQGTWVVVVHAAVALLPLTDTKREVSIYTPNWG